MRQLAPDRGLGDHRDVVEPEIHDEISDSRTGVSADQVQEAEIEERRQKGLPSVPPAQTPWQKIYRQEATQLSDGAVFRSAGGFHQIGRT
jgi:dihydroxyacid dehydratase/phosphogluconate dehydratase